jgi:CheY-like chemotaxis protein
MDFHYILGDTTLLTWPLSFHSRRGGLRPFSEPQSARRRPELPVILITGRHEIADQQRAIAQGSRFFRKPFDGQALLAAISQALPSVNRGE